jgi:CO/xanthine dehydrogenase Mo-binding subunit
MHLPDLNSNLKKAANMPLDIETGKGDPFPVYFSATQIAEAEVNIKTGLAKVLKIVTVNDIGKAINPPLVKGQITGGSSWVSTRHFRKRLF